jgi:hypothetical protein
MRFRIVRDLITHSGLEGKPAPVLEVGVKFAIHAEKNVTFDTPVIGNITG